MADRPENDVHVLWRRQLEELPSSVHLVTCRAVLLDLPKIET